MFSHLLVRVQMQEDTEVNSNREYLSLQKNSAFQVACMFRP